MQVECTDRRQELQTMQFNTLEMAFSLPRLASPSSSFPRLEPKGFMDKIINIITDGRRHYHYTSACLFHPFVSSSSSRTGLLNYDLISCFRLPTTHSVGWLMPSNLFGFAWGHVLESTYTVFYWRCHRLVPGPETNPGTQQMGCSVIWEHFSGAE